MSTEFVQITEVKVGDRIFFPNSRHPQTVDEVSETTMSPTGGVGTKGLRLKEGSSTWLLPENEMVKKYTEDE